MCRLRLGLAASVILLLATSQAFAASRTWDGGAGDNIWSTATNWNPDGFATNDDLTVSSAVALAAESAAVQVTGDGSLTIALGGSLDVTGTSDLRLLGNSVLNIEGTLQRTTGTNWFRFGDGGNLNATINHVGTLSTTAPPMIAFNQYAGSGQTTYNITDGVFSTTSYVCLGWSYATDTGSMVGTVNQSGDSVVTVGSSIQLGVSNGSNTVGGTGAGYYNMSGGTLNAANIYVGNWDGAGTVTNGASTGVFTQTGGTVGGTTRPNVLIAVGGSSIGSYVMRGGVLNAVQLGDNAVGAASTLKIQGGTGMIDVSGALSFTGVNSTIAVDVGGTGLTTINVSGTGTANVGTSTDLVASVYGGAALNASDTFTVLRLASESIVGSFVDQTGPLWTLSQTSNQIDLGLAAAADKGTIAVGSAVTGLDDSFGWLTVLSGGFGPGVFPMEMRLVGEGSVDNLAQWMTNAGLNATADSVTNTITLADLDVPSGGPSYFFWDLTAYNAESGATFAVTGLTAVPEPSSLLLMAIGLVGLAVGRRARRHTRSDRRCA